MLVGKVIFMPDTNPAHAEPKYLSEKLQLYKSRVHHPDGGAQRLGASTGVSSKVRFE